MKRNTGYRKIRKISPQLPPPSPTPGDLFASCLFSAYNPIPKGSGAYHPRSPSQNESNNLEKVRRSDTNGRISPEPPIIRSIRPEGSHHPKGRPRPPEGSHFQQKTGSAPHLKYLSIPKISEFRSPRRPSFDPGDSRPPRARPLAGPLPKVGTRRMGAEIARRSPTAPSTTSRPQARPSFGKPPPPEAPDAPSSPRHHRQPHPEVLDPTNRKKTTPQDDPDQKKMPSGYPSAPPPPPSRREPSTA